MIILVIILALQIFLPSDLYNLSFWQWKNLFTGQKGFLLTPFSVRKVSRSSGWKIQLLHYLHRHFVQSGRYGQLRSCTTFSRLVHFIQGRLEFGTSPIEYVFPQPPSRLHRDAFILLISYPSSFLS